jgi:cation diffusion facilitator CzcD-associated flavoprotein CzcO
MKLTSSHADLLLDDAASAEWCEFIAGMIRSIVRGPETAERLIPKDHRFGEKRPPFVTCYLEAFNDPKVSFVDVRETPIVRMTGTASRRRTGCRSSTWSCGRPASTSAQARTAARVSGAGTAGSSWSTGADGPTTFLGLQTHGFPNLFFPGGPHAAAGNNPRYNGDQVDFVIDVLVHARDAAAMSGRCAANCGLSTFGDLDCAKPGWPPRAGHDGCERAESRDT